MNPIHSSERGPLAGWLGDVRAILMRNLLQLRRTPAIVAFSVIQPIMFVVLFTQIYGGVVHVQGSDYTQFLMAGVFGQTIVFGTTASAPFPWLPAQSWWLVPWLTSSWRPAPWL